MPQVYCVSWFLIIWLLSNLLGNLCHYTYNIFGTWGKKELASHCCLLKVNHAAVNSLQSITKSWSNPSEGLLLLSICMHTVQNAVYFECTSKTKFFFILFSQPERKDHIWSGLTYRCSACDPQASPRHFVWTTAGNEADLHLSVLSQTSWLWWSTVLLNDLKHRLETVGGNLKTEWNISHILQVAPSDDSIFDNK